MKLGLSTLSRISLYAGVAAVALGLAGLPASDAFADGKGQNAGASQKGQGGKGGKGGGHAGGSKRDVTRALTDEADDDSDRPDWAKGNKDENPHIRGGGQPGDRGGKMGDLYGDLVLIVRDPVTGLPVYEDGELLICTNADCTTTVKTVDLEIPEGTTTFEVDFGRASIARTVDKVISQALTEVEEKLADADDGSITTDEAGRITFTVNGETFTIDSPRENLAVYIDLMEYLATGTPTTLSTLLGSLATLSTAAGSLAGVGDKTGDISLDYLYYQNRIVFDGETFMVVSGDDTYYDFSAFTYDRTYNPTYTYVLSTDGTTYVNKTLDINDYLEAINGPLPAATDKAALFAAAADDALEVIELLHTQVFTSVLPGTI